MILSPWLASIVGPGNKPEDESATERAYASGYGLTIDDKHALGEAVGGTVHLGDDEVVGPRRRGLTDDATDDKVVGAGDRNGGRAADKSGRGWLRQGASICAGQKSESDRSENERKTKSGVAHAE